MKIRVRRKTGTTPQGRGRFPDFDVLNEVDHWDELTRAVVVDRLTTPPVAFFSADEEPTARALVDLLLAQDADPRVPVLEMIDARLLAGIGDGYRYSSLPEDPEAWRQSVAGLDEDAYAAHGMRFSELPPGRQAKLIEDVRRNDDWHGLPGSTLFSLWMRYACTAFYSHPWAWNEIGFPGPAYPRGYKTLAPDRLESFEVRESDARDPIPWATKVDEATDKHQDMLEDLDRPGH
ncbi:MAG: gluconate 2-dehydrogenase subunit 3 family protein [Acidimicrobiales bacterium]